MQFEQTEEQSRLIGRAREFTRERIAPAAAEHDRSAEFPHEIVEEARREGLSNLIAPEEYGGEGLGPVEVCMVCEELSWGCLGIGGAISLNNLAADCLNIAGTGSQKEKYLTRLCAGGGFASYAATEPGTGSDVASISTRAERRDGGWVLSGEKIWTGHAAEASFMVVFAKTDPEAGHRGISAFLVDADLPGVEVKRKIPKMGQRAYSSCEVAFHDVQLSEESLLGEESEGFRIAMKVFDRSRPMVASFAVGLAQRCLDEALGYAGQREAFGQPIAAFQGVGFKLAEMGMKTEAARLLTHKAAWRAARGERNTLEAAYAKTFAADTAMEAATEAVQVFGGRGYSQDYPVEKLFRDAKALQIYEGTGEVQRQIMVRELGRAAADGAARPAERMKQS